MNDLVARLRDWRSLHLTRLGELFEEAATEIEELRLTDEEREAIEWCISRPQTHWQHGIYAATLRKLLKGTK